MGLAGLLLLAGVAACGADTAQPADDPTPGSPVGTDTAGSSGDPGGSPSGAGESSGDPYRDEFLYGTFRRGGVPVPPDVRSAAEDACRTKPAPAYAEEIGSRPLVVADLRGLGVLVLVFADGKGASGCRVEVDQTGAMEATHFAVATDPEGELERGEITLGALEYVEDGTSQRTLTVGRVGEGAVKVRAGFDDDTYVTSTMDNGWYAMWWPGSVKAAVIVAADNRNVAMGKLTPP